MPANYTVSLELDPSGELLGNLIKKEKNNTTKTTKNTKNLKKRSVVRNYKSIPKKQPMPTNYNKVRAKFRVDTVRPDTYGTTHTVKLSSVYSSDPNSENKLFWDATPAGEISLSLVGNNVQGNTIQYFKEGVEYYVDFIKADN